jgi:hypothetical protein
LTIETKLEPDAPDVSPTPVDFAGMVVNEVRSRGRQSRVSIQNFEWRTLAEGQRVALEIATTAPTKADASPKSDPGPLVCAWTRASGSPFQVLAMACAGLGLLLVPVGPLAPLPRRRTSL